MVIDCAFVVVGLILFIYARRLSIRYNAWTTRLRERNPRFSPPPTPEWRERNTTIFQILLRVAGVFFMLRGLAGLIATVKAR